MNTHTDVGRLQPEQAFPRLAEFEDGSLDLGPFDHTAHVYVVWALLEECSVIDAIQRFTRGLRQIVRIHDIKGKYHETLSCFLILEIAERKSRGGYECWSEFAKANADLLTGCRALLHRHYSPLRLESPLARRQFLLPDRTFAS